MPLYVGLMSGTSMDGIDAVLLDVGAGGMTLRGAARRDWEPALVARLRVATERPEAVGLDELGALDVAVGVAFADAARALLDATGVAAGAIRAVGSHGQTIRHRPGGASPFTLQIGDPNVLAERLGIDVVGDFRRRDVAAGGQGAPLAPAFHAAAFASDDEARAVLNVGGIANLTLLIPGAPVVGFDAGPGNCLMDDWSRRHAGRPYDRRGAWAASGTIDPALLARCLDEPFFAAPPPKSTGRELFNAGWLSARLGATPGAPADVQATLLALTVRAIADALRSAAGGAPPARVLVCGGGAFNTHLLSQLAAELPALRIETTAAYGIAPDHVEAAAFAWLAHRRLEGEAGNLPSVTGARHAAPLGAVYRGALR